MPWVSVLVKVAQGGTVIFTYDESGHLIGEYSGTGTLIEETVWLGDIPVATLRPDLNGGVDIYYVHTDQLNAPRRVTRPSDNAVVWAWTSDPFGNGFVDQNPVGDGQYFVYGLRFPGQYYDAETGVNYNYLRDYDPQVGRYAESDSMGLAGGSYSTYAYVGGNPVSFSDPLGRATVVVYSGPTVGNPFGHVALGFTGNGIYSYGTSEQYGANAYTYIQDQVTDRNVTVTTLNTTPAQEQAMMDYYRQNYGRGSKYSAIDHNCANAALGALNAADVFDAIMTGIVYPADISTAVEGLPGAVTQHLARDSQVPSSFYGFNPL
jgi:RHS repeat-associated protein